MTTLPTRHALIIDLARTQGRVTVDGLAERFAVSVQTIRKDLNELCEQRLLSRVHGGAVPASGVDNLAYAARRNLMAEAKRRIGAAAAALVPDGSSLFVNIGTTTEEVARALVGRSRLLVITNNIHVVTILLPSPGIEVVVAGGMVRRADGGIVGEATLDLVGQFKVDWAVIGASAIDEDGVLLDYDWREVRVAQQIIRNARRVMLVADSSKFGRFAPARIAAMAELDVLVTDAPPPERLAEACRQAGVQILIPGDPESETVAVSH
jgi:DeoR family glycerol-3-phosphate regulon repressor